MIKPFMIELEPGGLKGRLTLPPSKSHTLRAILFATIATGTSRIDNILESPDTDAMIVACGKLGATIVKHENSLEITGGINYQLKEAHVDAGNSGMVLRFIAAAGALTSALITLTGDESCTARRPCRPLVDALEQMGAICSSEGFCAPISVQGPIHPAKVVMDGQDSQPVSAIMIAAAMLVGTTEITIENLGERPWLEVTCDWLKRLGVQYEKKGESCYIIEGKGHISSFCYSVPADLSSLAFPLVAALLTDSELVIENVDIQDVQGDKIILSILERMGAKFLIEHNTIYIRGPQKLHGCDIDVNDCIDALPILSVLGCMASGTTRLYNGAIARKKESDRIGAMHKELTKMGANIVEHADGLSITQGNLVGASLNAHSDHRVALALAVAALIAKGKSNLAGHETVKKTYKNFFLEIQRLKDNIC